MSNILIIIPVGADGELIVDSEFPLTEEQYIKKTGCIPIDDDLDRVNCNDWGLVGHSQCGWCGYCDAPRFQCGCTVKPVSSTVK